MKKLDPRVTVLFFIKTFLSVIYIIPLWFIGIFIFDKVWISNTEIMPKEVIILILDGAGSILFVLLMLCCYIWSLLRYNHFTYGLQQDGLHIQKGVLIRRNIVIPYQDIAGVELLINPFVLRFLQLCTLLIQTREISNTEGILRKKHTLHILGITYEEGRFLRPEILKYSHIQNLRKTYFNPISGKYI